jgi:2-keto-4-pentenoate hydratase
MDADKAAAALISARQGHIALHALPVGLPESATLADGYAVQDAMIEATHKPHVALGALSGWKARARVGWGGGRHGTCLSVASCAC